jgi:hypothetical protein
MAFHSDFRFLAVGSLPCGGSQPSIHGKIFLQRATAIPGSPSLSTRLSLTMGSHIWGPVIQRLGTISPSERGECSRRGGWLPIRPARPVLPNLLPCLSPPILSLSLLPNHLLPNPSRHQRNTRSPTVNSMVGNGGYKRAATGGRRRDCDRRRRPSTAPTGGRPWRRRAGVQGDAMARRSHMRLLLSAILLLPLLLPFFLSMACSFPPSLPLSMTWWGKGGGRQEMGWLLGIPLSPWRWC